MTFRGERFDGNGLQLSALPTLASLDDVLQTYARLLWRQKGGKGRPAPDGDIDIRVRSLTPGKSLTAEIIADVPLQLDLFSKIDSLDIRSKVVEATVKLGDAFLTAADNSAIEQRLPREVLPPFRRMFNTLRDDEELVLDVEPARRLMLYARPTAPIVPITRPPIQAAARAASPVWQTSAPTAPYLARPRLDPDQRTGVGFDFSTPLRLLQRASVGPMSLVDEQPTRPGTEPKSEEPPARAVVMDSAFKSSLSSAVARASSTKETITGEVQMASVRGSAAVRVDNHDVQVRFKPEDEKKITRALHEHESVRVRIRGPGEIDLRTGNLVKIVADRVRIIEPVSPNAVTAERLEVMASEAPDDLLLLIKDGSLPPHLLSFAAEYAGQSLPAVKIVPVLMALLKHEFPTVREAAMYGLSRHPTPETIAALKDVAKKDHPILREIANGILASFEEGQ